MTSTNPSLDAAPGLGIIRVSGDDAAAFLNAQLTQNLRGLDTRTARSAAWLDPRGRVLAVFDVVATATAVDLVTATELIQTTARRLRLYVLRAKVAIETPDDCPIAAFVGNAGDGPATAGVTLEPGAGARTSAAGIEWFRVGSELAYAYPALGAAGNRAARAEIRLGRPLITAATAGRFTAHMLNLDVLGAIAFDKGCYPGQEVVARTRTLGAVRRRMYGFVAAPAAAAATAAGPTGDAVPAAGDPVLAADGEEVGTVIRAARGDDGFELLAVVRTDAVKGPLTLAGTAAALARRPVPGEPAD